MLIINGLEIAGKIKKELATEVLCLTKHFGIKPKIATILVGENPASVIYVNRKHQEAQKIGIDTKIIKLPDNIKENNLISIINELNCDNSVHAILVQLPLPAHLNKFNVINAIDPNKDVDGLTIVNAGGMSTGNIKGSLLPCTPQGAIALVKSIKTDLSGLDVLVIGKSNLVGKPLADLLLLEHCTVAVAHHKTKDLRSLTKWADLIFVATGNPGLITGDMIKSGCILIDIGISRVGDRIVGDCDFESCKDVASFITPVPGGVGPMTIAYLLKNIITCYKIFNKYV